MGEFQVCTVLPNVTVVALIMWAPKIVKNNNFWYKFARQRKTHSPQKNFNIGSLLQTFLYAMEP